MGFPNSCSSRPLHDAVRSLQETTGSPHPLWPLSPHRVSPATLLVFSPRLPIWNLQGQPRGRGLHALSHQQPDHLRRGDQLRLPQRVLQSRPGPPRHALHKYARGPCRAMPHCGPSPPQKARSKGWAAAWLPPAFPERGAANHLVGGEMENWLEKDHPGVAARPMLSDRGAGIWLRPSACQSHGG